MTQTVSVPATEAPAAARAARLLRRAAPLFVLLVVVAAVRALIPPAGMRADYFASRDWSGAPAHAGVDRDVSAAQVLRSWNYDAPATFSVQWTGWLSVDRPGDYVFSLASDGESRLIVDGAQLVDNPHPGGSAAGVRLDAGSHEIVVRFAQPGGSYRIVWSWARGSEALVPVPGWRLSPRRATFAALLAARVVDLLWLPLVFACVLVACAAGWCLVPSRERDTADDIGAVPRVDWRPSLLALALFAALAVVHTWPLATDPGRLSRNDNADTALNEWTMAWVAHQAPRHPLALFDANIFYPERNVLALSEPLILQGLMAAPVLRLGGSPVLAYNLVLLAGFALTGWAMCLVMRVWTGSWLAGFASGAILAFNAHTLTRLPHIQAQHAEFLPLALFALDSLLRRPRWRTAVWLAVWTLLQGLASIHTLVFTVIALTIGVIVRPEAWAGAAFRRTAPKLAGAAVIGGAALLPLLLPFWRLHAAGFIRSLDETAFFAAHASDYLAGQSRLFARPAVNAALFPGALAALLAAAAIVSRAAFRDPRARMCLAFGACGVLLSFGPAVVPGYELLYSTVPLIGAIRVSARFGYLGIVAVAALAGYTVAVVHRACRGRAAVVAPALLAALVAFEPLAAPISYTPAAPIPSIYALAGRDAIVAELPFPPPEAQYRNAPFLLDSTRNWRPLLNGYSGFLPPSYVAHYAALRGFPEGAAIDALQAFGVTDVFVHLDQLPAGTEPRLALPRLERVAAEGPVVLYRIRPVRTAADLRR